MLALLGKKFARDQDGVVLVETLLAVPVLTILTFGILEIGNIMWQRQQLQVGVRDAARYWSRCRPDHIDCTGRAKNIAVFGKPVADGSDAARVPGWTVTGVTIKREEPVLGPTDLVEVIGNTTYQGSPFYSAVFGSLVTIGYSIQMRYIGW